MVAQWWEHSTPTNVARVQIPASTPYVGIVCCWFSRLLQEVVLRVLRFSLSSKTNISKFRFDQESGRRRTTLWMCYLQIVIYLFIYLFKSYLLMVSSLILLRSLRVYILKQLFFEIEVNSGRWLNWGKSLVIHCAFLTAHNKIAAVKKSIRNNIIKMKLTKEKRFWNFRLRLFLAEMRLSVLAMCIM